MTSISSIDTSLYSGLIEEIQATGGRNSSANPVQPSYDSTDIEPAQVDLSNYYSDITPGDLLRTVGDNVTKAADALDNAMVSALQNGYTVQDAVNIKLAEAAYKANAYVMKSTIDTFEFLI